MNHKPKLETLMQVLGRETPVSQITVDQCREYTRILEGLPPSFSLKGYKDLSAVSSSELAGKHDQTMDLTTRREYLNLARSLFQYALENEYIEKNPLIPGLIPPKKGNTRSLRSAFSKEDIKRIFNPETFNKWAGDSPARYWVPKLGIWTGGRLEELANLNACDVSIIKTETDGPLVCIDHNMDGGRTLKNPNAIRTIPLHPDIAKEFKAYAESVPQDGRLFPELSKANGRYSHALSKAFMRYLRVTCKITDPKKNFHSFRHTVTDCLWKAQVMESIIEELTGRAGKTETSRRYAKGYRVDTLYREAVLKLDFQVS
jgi:integrase